MDPEPLKTGFKSSETVVGFTSLTAFFTPFITGLATWDPDYCPLAAICITVLSGVNYLCRTGLKAAQIKWGADLSKVKRLVVEASQSKENTDA